MTKRSRNLSCLLLPSIVAGLVAGLAFFAGWGILRPDLPGGRAFAQIPGSRQQEGNLALPTHVVSPGQTIYSIARYYGVDMKLLVRLNGLKNPNRILAGQKLLIPWKKPSAPENDAAGIATGIGATAVFHRVRAGETLSRIAVRYQVSQSAIIAANALEDPDYLVSGQELLIPRFGPGKDTSPAGAAVAGSPQAPSPRPAYSPAQRTETPRRTQVASRGQSYARASTALDWPMYGRITSGFGPRWGRFHEGIDIAGATGASVRAAAAGVVRQSGWVGGYGKLVVLDHGDGLATYYGHNSQLLVTRGMSVERGQVISKVGSTGDSTGPHVHFEVRLHGQAKNPFLWLRGGGN
ncbi:MAG: peptidoglycan DD-metalloendopeptidase family protein [Firmicutes bacterium]|nr:peptidoglycan DD-metalloendopeptidase family protein [Bacillota bacterium]